MGLLDRLRGKPETAPWHRPLPGLCSCAQHIDTLATMVIEAAPPVSVGELLQADAVRVDESEDHFLFGAETGHRRGPYQWRLSYTAEVRRLYDDAAPASIDDMLFIQSGIEAVLRLDDSTLAVGSAELCERGIGAAFVTALANPRVRA